MKYTDKEYKSILKEVTNGTVISKEKYDGNKTPILHVCLKCDYSWKAQPASFLSTRARAKGGSEYRCRTCALIDRNKKNALSKEEVEKRLMSKFGNKIKLVSQYRPSSKQRFKCYECQGTFKATVHTVMSGKYACPSCAVVKRSKKNRYAYKEYERGGKIFKVQGYEPLALDWIFKKHKGLKVKDIEVESSGKVPVIDYKVGRRNHRYFPDMFIPSQNLIVEVKSTHTLGVINGRHWKRNQEKAKACISQGYKFNLLLMGPKGKRLWLPKDWYSLSRKDVLAQVAYRSGIHLED